MRLLLLLVPILSCYFAVAQIDSTWKDFPDLPGSVITIGKDAIERMPVTNIMELLQWAFAFAGNDRFGVHQYSFLTDDFVAVNPNAVNLSQIESITFFPVGKLTTRGNQALQGTFVFRLKKAKNGLTLISKNGITTSQIGLSFMASEDLRQSKPELFSYSEANWQFAGKKFQSSNAISWLQNNAGKTERSGLQATESFQFFNKRFRVSSFHQYQFNPSMNLHAGFTLTNQPIRASQQYVSKQGQFSSFMNYPDEVLQFSGHAGFQYRSGRWKNVLTAELVQKDVAYHSMSNETRTSGDITERSNKGEVKAKQIFITNTTRWAILEKSNFRLGADLVMRYRWENGNYRWSSFVRSSGMMSEFGEDTRTSLRQATASSLFNFQVKEWFRAAGGVSLEHLKLKEPVVNGPRPTPNAFMFEALAEINLSPWLHVPTISMLKLSSHYLEYSTTPFRYDGLDRYNYFYSSTSFPYSQAWPTYGSARRWLQNLAIRLRGDWQASLMRIDDRKPMQANVPVFTGTGFNYQPVLLHVAHTGWGLEVQGIIVNRNQLRWQLQASVFNEKNNILKSDVPLTHDVYSRKTQWYSSFHTDVHFQRFFLQATALFAWNGSQQVLIRREANVNQQQLRFLSAGYRFSFPHSIVPELECNVQTRNLAWGGPQYPYTGRYWGLGLKADFQFKPQRVSPVK